MVWLLFAVIAAIVAFAYAQWSAGREMDLLPRITRDRGYRERMIFSLTQKISTFSASSISAKRKNKIAELYAERARLHYFSGDGEKAIIDAENAIAHADNSVGFLPELIEYALIAHRFDAADSAVKRLLNERGSPHDHALASRFFMTVGNYDLAEASLKTWKISADAQRTQSTAGKIQSEKIAEENSENSDEPAQTYYGHLLALLKNKSSRADAEQAAKNFKQSGKNRDYWDALFPSRIFALFSPASAADFPDYFADDYPPMTARITFADFNDEAKEKIRSAIQKMANVFLPQSLMIFCRDTDIRDAAMEFAEQLDLENDG